MTGVFLLAGAILLSSLLPPLATASSSALIVVAIALTGPCLLGAIAAVGVFIRRIRPIYSYQPSRVLVVMPKWIGDIIMATGFLRAMRELLDGMGRGRVVLDLLMREGTKDLLMLDQKRPFDEVVEYAWELDTFQGVRETFLDRFFESVRTAGRIRARNYDMAILLTHTMRHALMTLAAGIPRRFGYGFPEQKYFLSDPLPPPNRARGHETRTVRSLYYLGLAQYLGYWRGDEPPYLGADPGAEELVGKLLKEKGILYNDPYYVSIAPGASSAEKTWPIERFGELVLRLKRDAGFTTPFLFTFGPGEEKLKIALRGLFENEGETFYYFTHNELTLSMLAALMRKALLVVCNDSAPLHLARVTGTWSLALCGPTNPLYHAYWAEGPYRLLYPKDGVKCDGAGHMCPRAGRGKCMHLISVDDVLGEAKELLNRSILVRKIDQVIQKCLDDQSAEQLFRGLGERIARCITFLEKEKPKLEEATRGKALDLDWSLRERNLERLGYVYLLLDNRQMAVAVFRQLESERCEQGLRSADASERARERNSAGRAQTAGEQPLRLGFSQEEDPVKGMVDTYVRLRMQERRPRPIIEGNMLY